MRKQLLKEMVQKTNLIKWEYDVVFWDELSTDEYTNIEIKFNEDGVIAGIEWEYGNLFIVGLTPEEQAYIEEMI